MKKIKLISQIILFSSLIGVILMSCQNKNSDNIWDKEIKITEKVKIINISEEFFSPNVSLNDFKTKYPWFQGNIPDEEYLFRKKDTTEINIYKNAIKEIKTINLETELSEMFSRIRYYFPKFKTPKVYLYSSSLQGIKDPIFFRAEDEMLFIDISAFMGEKNSYYDGIDHYLRKTMTPKNIVPKVAEIIAETFILYNTQESKFIDQILISGKIKTLQKAFLPKTPDYLIMNYTQEQQEWAVANESNIWNYFVEQDLLFSDDSQLYERFLSIAPFSKFYTEVDQKSSPQVGVFIGWQISKAFFTQKPETTLSEFLTKNATEIFNQSKYKPQD